MKFQFGSPAKLTMRPAKISSKGRKGSFNRRAITGGAGNTSISFDFSKQNNVLWFVMF